jgi:WD40 repeat protein
MMHAESVFCVNFNKDSELLVSGSQDGQVKVCDAKGESACCG